MNHHYIIYCENCNCIINQCRCNGEKEIQYELCEKCAKNKLAYYQGTSDPDTDKGTKDTRTTKERQDQSTRKYVIFRNYDYTDAGPNETSPGGGLYHGPMDKYKSVKDFVEQRRKDNAKLDRNSQIRSAVLVKILEKSAKGSS